MKNFILNILIVGCLSSCLKDNIEDPNEEELITTLGIQLQNEKSQDQMTFLFRDLDGPGGAPPQQIDTIKLQADSIYDAQIIIGNESVSPAENIRVEVETEADDHQLYYVPSGISLQISELNKDSKGFDLGTISKWSTGAQSKGSIRITLKHKPGYKTANDAIDVGETDVEIEFPVVIQ